MPAALLGLVGRLGTFAAAGVKANPVTFIVKLCQSIFSGVLASIGLFWYTGWRRERVEKGSGKFPVPGISKLTKKYPASLADEPLSVGEPATDEQVANPGVNPPGSVPSGSKTGNKHESFDPIRFAHRLHTATKIANQFRLHITSSHRTAAHNAEVGGVAQSLHVDGLAFDFVGAVQDMQRAMAWAKGQPEMFSEILVHNVGSGLHLHLAFWPGAGL